MAQAIPSRHGFYDECLLGPVKFSLGLSHRADCRACDDVDMREAGRGLNRCGLRITNRLIQRHSR